jgi:hypothetical protein
LLWSRGFVFPTIAAAVSVIQTYGRTQDTEDETKGLNLIALFHFLARTACFQPTTNALQAVGIGRQEWIGSQTSRDQL